MLCVFLAYSKLTDKVVYGELVNYKYNEDNSNIIEGFKERTTRGTGMYLNNLYFTKITLDYNTEEPI